MERQYIDETILYTLIEDSETTYVVKSPSLGILLAVRLSADGSIQSVPDGEAEGIVERMEVF